MHQRSAMAILLGALSACVNKPPTTIAVPDAAATTRALEEGRRAYGIRHYEQALETLGSLANSTDFPALSASERIEVLSAAGSAAHQLHDDRTSFEYFRRATQIPDAPADTWLARARAGASLQDRADVFLSLSTYIERSPESLKHLDNQMLNRLVLDAAKLPTSSGLELRFLRALYHVHCLLDDGEEPSFAWRRLVQRALDAGANSEAADVARHVNDVDVLIQMRIDRRFDAIVSRSREQFDIDAAAERELRQTEAAVERTPHLLQKSNRLMEELIRRGRYATALAVSDSIQEDRARHIGDRNYLLTMGDDYNWTLDMRARALAGLNRWDEAVQQREEARHLREDGADNVSQVLNLAEINNDLGHPERAIVVLDGLEGRPNEYGSSVMAYERLRASLQLGDAHQVAESLQYLSDHRTEALRSYQDALVAVGDTEGAAKLLIRRLSDPEQRIDALQAVQNYLQSPMTPILAAQVARFKSVVARRDVQAAIQKVGRIETFSITSPDE